MAVLIEGISVVIRASALHQFPSRLSAFKAAVPNKTLCDDSELVRVGFMHPADVESYVRELEQLGLRYIVNGAAQDLVVVDQLAGFAVPCEWAEVCRRDISPGQRVAACSLRNSEIHQLVLPHEWAWGTSLSASFGFVPTDASGSLRKVGQKGNIEEHISPLSNRPLYVGRTTQVSTNRISASNAEPTEREVDRIEMA